MSKASYIYFFFFFFFTQKCNQMHGEKKFKKIHENIYKKLCGHYLFYSSY